MISKQWSYHQSNLSWNAHLKGDCMGPSGLLKWLIMSLTIHNSSGIIGTADGKQDEIGDRLSDTDDMSDSDFSDLSDEDTAEFY